MTYSTQEIQAYQHIDKAAHQKKTGLLAEAEQSYIDALKAVPNNVIALYNLANLQKMQGRSCDAQDNYRRAIALEPSLVEAHFNLGNLMQAMGDFAGAAAHYQEITRINPTFAPAHSCLGVVLVQLKQFDAAYMYHQNALKLHPNSPNALCNFAAYFAELGQFADAQNVLNRALDIQADMPQAIYGMAMVQSAVGTTDKAISLFKRCIQLKYEPSLATQGLLFALASEAKVSTQTYLSEARQFEVSLLSDAQRQIASVQKFSRNERIGRFLRIGYLSGDYLSHAVSYFSEPLFHHHDRARVKLIAYTTNANEDEVTDRFKALCDEWVPLVGMSDEQACERVRADEIDVLVDLMGYTMWNRLGIFARRAAPIQTHYLGYFASTGLSEMDYWLGDEVLSPTVCDLQFSETIWRLPRAWMAYHGRNDAPLCNWRPNQDGDGAIWLGSFNNLAKITSETLKLWSEVLQRIPQAKLLLKTKALKYPSNQQRIYENFRLQGIALERILLMSDTTSWEAHMSLYDRLDIALDPIGGWCGATTSCDALWMGVPVITLGGEWVGQRMTASLVDGLGHPEWIAKNKGDYVNKVVDLAGDIDYRKTLRSNQREKMRRSPICDAAGLAQALECAYEGMFDKWWAQQ